MDDKSSKAVADYLRTIAEIIESRGDWNARSMADMAEATATLIEVEPIAAKHLLNLMAGGIRTVLKSNGKA